MAARILNMKSMAYKPWNIDLGAFKASLRLIRDTKKPVMHWLFSIQSIRIRYIILTLEKFKNWGE